MLGHSNQTVYPLCWDIPIKQYTLFVGTFQSNSIPSLLGHSNQTVYPLCWDIPLRHYPLCWDIPLKQYPLCWDIPIKQYTLFVGTFQSNSIPSLLGHSNQTVYPLCWDIPIKQYTLFVGTFQSNSIPSLLGHSNQAVYPLCWDIPIKQYTLFVGTLIIIIIIAFKGAIRDLLQSPHSAANCLQHARSSGPGVIVCKSRAPHRALITCNMSCYVPLGTKGQLSYEV